MLEGRPQRGKARQTEHSHTRAGIYARDRGATMPGRNGFSDDKKGSYNPLSLGEWSDDSSDEGERDFVRDQIRSQRQQLKQQDEGLDMLGKSAERLGQLSMNISEELGQQNKMLDDMETGLDQATARLDFVTQKTKELISRSGGKQNFLIIVTLVAIAFILFLLVLYT